MATLVLSGVGAAVGGGFGGSFLGLSAAALGKAAGATIGSAIDQKLLGHGSAAVESGRVDRIRVMGSSEGAALPRVFGRMRIAGQIIWSSRFFEDATSERVGGKGTGRASRTVRQYRYSISLAIALCEGEVMRVGRIWADGQPLSQLNLNWRLHLGTDDQLPDPVIAAIEGNADAPAYRGTAYVVFEDLDLAPFGNRIPQFNFEVFRRARATGTDLPTPASLDIRAVALVPGTGEYALATEPVNIRRGLGEAPYVNVNNDRGQPDLLVSLDQMEAELPSCEAVSLVVSWFGNDLRAGTCELYPAVEQREADGSQPWRVAGLSRNEARQVSQVDGRPLFGGTPSDQSVVQAIRHMAAAGSAVMFYPFILMDITAGNGLPDPWNTGPEQPPVPWRGRITLSIAPGHSGTVDKTATAADEVDRFLGQAAVSDFSISGETVVYTGPNEWSYRRFILHYAHLCKMAGGLDSFCIGSELRSLTQIRSGQSEYPFVTSLKRLAQEVKSILGSSVKIGYAADWSEYFGHHPSDGSGDVVFHLDPLWSDTSIDFIGIDNYMPISDWRPGLDHTDIDARAIYNTDYLKANVAGGEGFDWFYRDQSQRESQLREEIRDDAYGEPWVFRYKDLVNWWSRPHVNRLGGERVNQPTAWVPQSKPIWFTELGCPAVDMGTNQPNVFNDPKSSESFFPYYSSGKSDDHIQHAYLQAIYAYWQASDANPVSSIYGETMVDLARAFVWAWDARPWPDFPQRSHTWVDGANYERGHWLNGRIASPSVAEVAADLCVAAGVRELHLTQLHGSLTGYAILEPETARQSLQPLLLSYDLVMNSSADRLVFKSHEYSVDVRIDVDRTVYENGQGELSVVRGPWGEGPDRLRLGFFEDGSDYRVGSVDASRPGPREPNVSESFIPLVLPLETASDVVHRWHQQSHAGKDSVQFSLPLSAMSIECGDHIVVAQLRDDRFRVESLADRTHRAVTASRRFDAVNASRLGRQTRSTSIDLVRPSPAYGVLLDVPSSLHKVRPGTASLAAFHRPWQGPIALYASARQQPPEFLAIAERPATFGTLLDPLPFATSGQFMNWSGRIKLNSGELQEKIIESFLNVDNEVAIFCLKENLIELVQIQQFEQIDLYEYIIKSILRGQGGTDVVIPPVWSTGTSFVLIDESTVEVDLLRYSAADPVDFQVGLMDVAPNDPSYAQVECIFSGSRDRLYSPVHIRGTPAEDGGVMLSWIPRSVEIADDWNVVDGYTDPPRLFLVEVFSIGNLVRSKIADGSKSWYRREEMESDGLVGHFHVSVSGIDRNGIKGRAGSARVEIAALQI